MRSLLCCAIAILGLGLAAGAAETVDCPDCKGAGKLTHVCGQCDGKGDIQCQTCNSKDGGVVCPTCRGRRRVTDSFGAQVGCPTCRGVGRVRCTECKGGRISCPECKGQKKIAETCKRCAGTGKLALETEPALNPADAGGKAALEMEARRLQIKLQIIKLQEEIASLKKQLAEIEMKLAKPAPAPAPAPAAPDQPKPKDKDDF